MLKLMGIPVVQAPC